MLNDTSSGPSRIDRLASRIAYGVIVVAALLAIAWVMRTLILMLLLALVGVAVILPVHRFLEERVGTAPAAVLATTTLFGGVCLALGGVGLLMHLEQDTLTESLRVAAEDLMPRAQRIPPLRDLMQPEMLKNIAAMGVGTGGMLGSILVAMFLVLLSLLDAEGWRRRFGMLLGEGNMARGRSIFLKIRQYYGTRSLVCVISGVISGLWMMYLGVPSAWVWAVVIMVLNFIPTLGSWIAAIPPVAITFATVDAQTAMLVAAGLFAQEQVVGNGLDPLLQGSKLSLNPTSLLLSVVVATIVLGFAGAFFAGPIVILTVAVLDAFPTTRPLTVLLQDEERAEARASRNLDHPELARSTVDAG